MNTPTPVQVEFLGTEAIITTLDEPIAKLFKHPDAPERAAEIVRAVNYHDRLVSFMKNIVMATKHEFDVNKNSAIIIEAQQLLTEIEKSK